MKSGDQTAKPLAPYDKKLDRRDVSRESLLRP